MRPFYKRPLFWIAVAAVCAALIALCVWFSLTVLGSASAGIGDRYDDPEWIASSNSHAAVGIATQEAQHDGVYTASVKARAFNGCHTLWKGRGDGRPVSFSLAQSVGEGRFKVVLVAEDGAYLDLSAQAPECTAEFTGAGEVKMVGDAAKDLSLSLKIIKE